MKKHLSALFISFLALSAFIFWYQSRQLVKDERYYETVARYVYAYSGGAVNNSEPLRVRFVNPAVSKAQTGQPVPTRVFSISPVVKGTAVWEDDHTILFKPEQPLPVGKKFSARLALDEIYPGIPEYAETFEYDFRIRELSFRVQREGINSEPADPKLQNVTGVVHVNEPCDAFRVEKMLSARQSGRVLQVNWTPGADKRTYAWTVDGVERSDERSEVKLSWNGESLGSGQTYDDTQVVAPQDEFTVLSATVVQLEEQYILINFSDPVSPGQDLNGLVRLSEYKGDLRFVVNGNFVRVYPSQRIVGEQTVTVDGAVRNTAGKNLVSGYTGMLYFQDLNPEVRLVGRGSVIPSQENGSVLFPFEAVGLNAVDVEVFKIYNSNILQFLQVNDLEGNQELERVGKIVLQKKIDLASLNPNASKSVWQRYAFDLGEMIRKDPGAIYQIRIAFRRDYTSCGSNGQSVPAFEREQTDDFGVKKSIMGGDRGIYWADDDPWWWADDDEDNPAAYDWGKQSEPCALEYYNSEHFARRNVFVSNLGITGKLGRDGSLFLAVNDLHTTRPISNIDIELLDYQLQTILKTKAGEDGTVMLEGLVTRPFLAVASDGASRGYLRMADGGALSLSRFDVAGVEPQRGLRGYIYGERGVWRPGDSLFLNFVLEDKSGRLPAGHPVTMEVSDSRGAMQFRRTLTEGVNGVFPFYFATGTDAPTGNWMCKVMVGGATFSKTIKIETVKPNRLKLDLNFGKTVLGSGDFATADDDNGLQGALRVNWLHGAVARGLKASVEMSVNVRKTEFARYKDFSFDDPSRYFSSEPEVLFDGVVDQGGLAKIPLKIGQMNESPGKLTANFKVRAFEQGGDFSTDNFNIEISPYDRYVGVFIPTNRWGSKIFDEKGGDVTFAMVDKNGNPLASQSLNVALYRVDWRWWWDENDNSGVGNFNYGEMNNAIAQTELVTNSRGQVTWKVRPNGWGRYLVRVTDAKGKHAGGDFFWTGYPDDQYDMSSRNAAAMLPFTADKEKYSLGETVTLKVPASEQGRILLTLETGSRVAKHFWYDAKAGDNLISFKADASMAPTVYAHVSLLQPHAQTVNDLPIRMYGVIPVLVEDQSSRLQAQIDMPETVRPGEYFNVSLREMGSKDCTYTIDIVDEGLLDLTRFKTPDPWEAFNAREALGVKTWDIYDFVLGAYAIELDRILAIGGDGINVKAKPASVNRFKPTVIHLGPFRLGKGQVARHRVKIDNYVGSVRVMAVLCDPAKAGVSGAHGSAEKTVPVKKPLMVLPTLPRVLGPGETLRLPVDVFAMEKNVQNATVSVREKTGLVSVEGAGYTSLAFSEPGNKMVFFNIKAGQKTGRARFNVSAEGGGESATTDIEVEIRNPNPAVTRIVEDIVEPGKTWTKPAGPTDLTDLTNVYLEISSVPPVNLSKQLDYLISYPHGCVEQVTSAAFPQLYVDVIAPLTDKQKQDTERNIKAAIARLQSFQLPSGAFSYWPGGSQAADWAGTYAGHFLLEARSKGYAVPDQLLSKWLDYQTKTSRLWEPVYNNNRNEGSLHDIELAQAYRLYTLALAQKPDVPGMNRLKESKNKYQSSANLLAAAYALTGRKEAAKDLLNDRSAKAFNYDWWGETYGSALRDLALRLETLAITGDTQRGTEVATQVASLVGNMSAWYSTQEVATSLRALARFIQGGAFNEKPVFTLKAGTRDVPVSSGTPYYIYNLAGESGAVTVRNTSGKRLYVRTVYNGRTATGSSQAESSNITLNMRYTNLAGSEIDPSKITQGTDFIAEVTVGRSAEMLFDFNEMALTQVFPSGWEIINTRMNAVGESNTGTSTPEYQDIRDDRVMTYFDIPFRGGNPDNQRPKVYRVLLNAAYAGRYYLAPVSCAAMYDNRIRASVPGKWVEVL